MDSPALVILGSSVLEAGLWFAGNILYSVILAGCKKSFGNVISAVSSNILALFASHTQERLRVCVRAVAIVCFGAPRCRSERSEVARVLCDIISLEQWFRDNV